MKVGLISDTHGFICDKVLSYLSSCDSIWHAGDIGSICVIKKLQSLSKELFLVYGNIDSSDIRLLAPKNQIFFAEGLKVAITHIGGYPNHYSIDAKQLIQQNKPDIFICGHSHILKIIRDKENNLIHLNPGAIGKTGFHKVRTLILFDIQDKKLKNIQVIEIKRY